MSAADAADPQPTVEQDALAPPSLDGGVAAVPERPELTIAAAFAGGLALALVLKRLGR
jgi:hypothetical protein